VAVKHLLLESLKFCNNKYNAIVAYALMPEHIHLLLYFKEETMLIEYMRDFKKFTSVQIRHHWQNEQPGILDQLHHRNRKQQFKVWMERFDDVILYSSRVCCIKLNYVNNNPKKRGLCTCSEEYEYSSARFYAGQTDPKLSCCI
jgi:putative transposase